MGVNFSCCKRKSQIGQEQQKDFQGSSTHIKNSAFETSRTVANLRQTSTRPVLSSLDNHDPQWKSKHTDEEDRLLNLPVIAKKRKIIKTTYKYQQEAEEGHSSTRNKNPVEPVEEIATSQKSDRKQSSNPAKDPVDIQTQFLFTITLGRFDQSRNSKRVLATRDRGSIQINLPGMSQKFSNSQEPAKSDESVSQNDAGLVTNLEVPEPSSKTVLKPVNQPKHTAYDRGRNIPTNGITNTFSEQIKSERMIRSLRSADIAYRANIKTKSMSNLIKLETMTPDFKSRPELTVQHATSHGHNQRKSQTSLGKQKESGTNIRHVAIPCSRQMVNIRGKKISDFKSSSQKKIKGGRKNTEKLNQNPEILKKMETSPNEAGSTGIQGHSQQKGNHSSSSPIRLKKKKNANSGNNTRDIMNQLKSFAVQHSLQSTFKSSQLKKIQSSSEDISPLNTPEPFNNSKFGDQNNIQRKSQFSRDSISPSVTPITPVFRRNQETTHYSLQKLQPGFVDVILEESFNNHNESGTSSSIMEHGFNRSQDGALKDITKIQPGHRDGESDYKMDDFIHANHTISTNNHQTFKHQPFFPVRDNLSKNSSFILNASGSHFGPESQKFQTRFHPFAYNVTEQDPRLNSSLQLQKSNLTQIQRSQTRTDSLINAKVSIFKRNQTIGQSHFKKRFQSSSDSSEESSISSEGDIRGLSKKSGLSGSRYGIQFVSNVSMNQTNAPTTLFMRQSKSPIWGSSIDKSQIFNKPCGSTLKAEVKGYHLITKLGEGSFASVYKARNDLDGNVYAIKVMDRKKYETLIKKENLGVNLQEELDITRLLVGVDPEILISRFIKILSDSRRLQSQKIRLVL